MQKQLTDIANSFGVGMTASKLQNTLNSVLKYLVKEKYLIQIGNVGSIYKATAKWSLLYDELEYIHSFDGFEIEKAQEELAQKLAQSAVKDTELDSNDVVEKYSEMSKQSTDSVETKKADNQKSTVKTEDSVTDNSAILEAKSKNKKFWKK